MSHGQERQQTAKKQHSGCARSILVNFEPIRKEKWWERVGPGFPTALSCGGATKRPLKRSMKLSALRPGQRQSKPTRKDT